LFFEFSGLNIEGGVEEIIKLFTVKIRMSLGKYFTTYGYPSIYEEELDDIDSPTLFF